MITDAFIRCTVFQKVVKHLQMFLGLRLICNLMSFEGFGIVNFIVIKGYSFQTFYGMHLRVYFGEVCQNFRLKFSDWSKDVYPIEPF